MKNLLKYKDYFGTVEYSTEDEIFFGKIFGIKDLVSYESDNVRGLQIAFAEAVEDYLLTCKQLGKKPQKEFKGSINVRLSSAKAHEEAAIISEEKRITLNKFISDAVEEKIQREKARGLLSA